MCVCVCVWEGGRGGHTYAHIIFVCVFECVYYVFVCAHMYTFALGGTCMCLCRCTCLLYVSACLSVCVFIWVYLGVCFICLSSTSVFDNKKAVRGGIPVVFREYLFYVQFTFLFLIHTTALLTDSEMFTRLQKHFSLL